MMYYEARHMEPGEMYLLYELPTDGSDRVITVLTKSDADFWAKELRRAYAKGAEDEAKSRERNQPRAKE